MQFRRTKFVILILLLMALLIGMSIILKSSILTSIFKFIASLDIAGFFIRFFDIEAINLATLKEIFSQLTIFYIGIVATVIIIHLIQLRSGPARLIIEKFRNASDVKFTPNEIISLSLESRKLLVEKIGRINHRIREHSSGDGPETYRAPLPSTHVLDAEQRLENVSDTLEEDVPRPVSWVMPFINLLMPSRSTKVACSLQQLANDGCPAFTFEIVDTSGKTKPDIYTIEHKAHIKHVDNHVKVRNGSTVPTSRAFNPMLALRETSQERRTQITLEAYRTLLPTAMNALAIEICKREMLAHLPLSCKILLTQNHYRAQVYNFFGSLYAAYAAPAHTRAGGDFYYKRASHNFEQAILLDKTWSLPYANLGDLYSIEGQQVGEQQGLTLQYTARDEYQQARKYFKPSLKWKMRKCFWTINETIQNKSKTRQCHGCKEDLPTFLADQKESGIFVRIIIGEAVINLLIDGTEYITIANNNIQQIEYAINNKTNLPDARVLYYLACWYALAYDLARKDKALAQAAEEYRGNACRYLASCLIRNSEEIFDNATIENHNDLDDLDWYYWKRAETDRDLDSIKPYLKSLKQAIKKQHKQIHIERKSGKNKQGQNTPLCKQKGEEFWQTIGKVLRDSQQLHQRRLMQALDNLPPLDEDPEEDSPGKGARGTQIESVRGTMVKRH